MHCRRFIDKRRGLYNAVGLKLYFDATARYNKNVRINDLQGREHVLAILRVHVGCGE